jgi:hypothetical protein
LLLKQIVPRKTGGFKTFGTIVLEGRIFIDGSSISRYAAVKLADCYFLTEAAEEVERFHRCECHGH